MKPIITDVLDPRFQEGTRPVAHHPPDGGMIRIMMRGTYEMSFGLRTCTIESRAVNKTEIG
jgi:hypothetical protein